MNQREKIIVGAAVLVAVLFGVPVAMDAMNSGANLDTTLARMETNRRTKEQEAARLDAKVKVLRPQVEALAWNVPPDQLRQQMVQRVTAFAQQAQVGVTTTRPLKPRSLDVMTEVSIEMHVSATLPQLVRFLYPLQQPGSKMTVDRLRIASANAETDLLDVDMTVSGYTLQTPDDVRATAPRKVT